MAVRIVRDYWTNVVSYQDLIKRCFSYLYRKFPNPQDGVQESYQDLLVRLYELDVFSRFDPRKILAAHGDLSEEQTKKVTTAKATKLLKKRGVNVDKKFEQFVYKWIEHILGESYHKRVNHRYRYVTSGDMDVHIADMKAVRDKFNENAWAQTPEELDYLQQHIINKNSKRWVRQYPVPGDIREFTGSKMDDPLDEVVAQDLQEEIRDHLTSRSERTLYNRTLDGLSGVEAGRLCNKTPQQVHIMMKSIRLKADVVAQ